MSVDPHALEDINNIPSATKDDKDIPTLETQIPENKNQIEDVPQADWNQPLKRPTLTPEQENTIKSFAQERKLTPEERLRQVILMPPQGFADFDSEEKKEDEVTNESFQEEKVPLDLNTVDFGGHPVPDDPAIEAQLKFLGVQETTKNDNPIMDPDVPVDAPVTINEIKTSITATPEELAERAEHNKPTTIVAEELDIVENTNTTLEPTHLEDLVSVLPNIAEKDKQEIEEKQAEVDVIIDRAKAEVTLETPSESNGDDIPVMEAAAEVLAPEVNKQLPEDLIEKADEIITKVEEKSKEMPVNVQQEISEGDELQDALGELPESQIEIGADEIEKVETSTQQSMPEVEVNEEDILLTTENKRGALRGISTLHAAAAFGETINQNDLFDTADLDISIQNDINPQHVIVPNMTPEQATQYTFETDPDGLQRSARQIFANEDPDAYRVTLAGINDLRENMASIDSYIARVHLANQQIFNPQSLFNARILKKAEEEYQATHPGKSLMLSRAIKIPNKEKDGKPTIVDDSFATSKAIFDKIEKGGIARVTDISATKIAAMVVNGYRVVRLYNSGFNVQLAAPRMDILGRYYSACRNNMGEFGRIFGQLAYLPIGVETRSALFDLFEQCVEGSNLKDWQEPGVLRKAVSSLDFSVIAWAMASLIYPKGVDIEYLCYNNDDKTGKRCRHVEKQLIDINSMRYNNWSKMTAEQVLYCASKDTRTLEDLEKYRADFVKSDGTLTDLSLDSTWKARFYIPTFHEAETAQRTYVATMAEHVQLNKIYDANRYYLSKQLAALAPYVKEILYTDTQQNKSLSFNSATALESALDYMQAQVNIDFIPFMENYIAEKTLSHICYTYHKCPECGKYPVDAVNGLAPCDPEYAFFVWAGAKVQA